MKKKMPDFFSNTPPVSNLEKAENQKRIKLMEGANRGRQANIVAENADEFEIAPRTGQKPFKVPATAGGIRTAPDKAALIWDKGRKHKVIQEGEAVPQDPKDKEVEPTKMKKRVFGSKDLHDLIPHSDKQKALVEGIDLAKVKPHGEGWTSSWAISGFGKNKEGTGVVFKGRMPQDIIEEHSYGKHMEMLTTAQREGLYHNLAHHMGLGQYVPTTAVLHDRTPGADIVSPDHGPSGNHYSVMEKIPGASFYSKGSKGDEALLKGLHETGELHKLAIMNAILHNTDRHSANWMVSPKGLHLIDHGLTFDYHNDERDFFYPSYLYTGQEAAGGKMHDKPSIHSNARKWLLGLDHENMKDFLEGHSLHEDFKRPILGSLLHAQKLAKMMPQIPIQDLLAEIAHHGKSYMKRKRV